MTGISGRPVTAVVARPHQAPTHAWPGAVESREQGQTWRNLRRVQPNAHKATAGRPALALVMTVLNTTVENHGIAWYKDEFARYDPPKGQGVAGYAASAGSLIGYVISNVPLPQPWQSVGPFDIRPHLTVRPLAHTFTGGVPTQETCNRHLISHRASHQSFRKEFLVPTLLCLHALLRGLEEKMCDDAE